MSSPYRGLRIQWCRRVKKKYTWGIIIRLLIKYSLILLIIHINVIHDPRLATGGSDHKLRVITGSVTETDVVVCTFDWKAHILSDTHDTCTQCSQHANVINYIVWRVSTKLACFVGYSIHNMHCNGNYKFLIGWIWSLGNIADWLLHDAAVIVQRFIYTDYTIHVSTLAGLHLVPGQPYIAIVHNII